MNFTVKCTLDVPDEKKPEEAKDYSFESVVLGTSKEKINVAGTQVTKTYFLVYDEKGKEFFWIDSLQCELLDYVELV